jgi:hypothetical protein
VPDYDGRPSPPPTAREALIWIPRGALYPAHLVAEYVLRRPLVAVIRWGELHSVWPRVYDFFTWDQGRSGVYPLATVDFGLKQTAGLGIVWRDFIVPNNALRASAYASTQGVLGTSAQDRLSIFRDGTGAVYIGGGFVKRPDGVFYGLGSDTSTEGKTFYSFVSPYGSLGLTGSLGGLSRVFAEVGYRRFTFDRSDISATTPSIDERFGGPGQAPLPPGFGAYDLVQSRLGFVLDSREPNIDVVPSGTGVRFQPEVAYALDPRHTALRFITWGASAGGFLDVSGARHVLALELAARFTENRGSDDIPFTELPTLGGAEWMRGFLGGRLRGRSTVVATAQYRYAFWTFADAELFSSLGNAFGSHLDDFAFDRLFLNMGAALRTTFTRDTSMTVTLAFGSNRLDAADFRLMDTTRFSFGVIHGY